LEPILIYEEIVIQRNLIRSTVYETRTIYTSQTYNGVTTTVSNRIGYYLIDNISVDGSILDAYKLVNSKTSFSSSGYAHVYYINAKHHQQGLDLNGNYRVVTNGNIYSQDRSYGSFSMYNSNGYTNWNKSVNTFSCITQLGYGGSIGTLYEIGFIWDIGGGQYKYSTLNRTNTIGQLPA
jgi:hypothetical protein